MDDAKVKQEPTPRRMEGYGAKVFLPRRCNARLKTVIRENRPRCFMFSCGVVNLPTRGCLPLLYSNLRPQIMTYFHHNSAVKLACDERMNRTFLQPQINVITVIGKLAYGIENALVVMRKKALVCIVPFR